jgi:hypothetical protein
MNSYLKILIVLIMTFGSFKSICYQSFHHDTLEIYHSDSTQHLFQEKILEEESSVKVKKLLSEIKNFDFSVDYSIRNFKFYVLNFYVASSQCYNFISHLPPPFSVKF